MFTEREICVFCDNKLESVLHIQEKTPIAIRFSNEIQQYEYEDMIWLECSKCNTIQLKKLIDPIKLYISQHNMTAETPTWKRHHSSFFEFIRNNMKGSRIIEIGGGNNVLSSKFVNTPVNYSVLDITNIEEKLESISYIQENCEDYDYSKFNTVIMSHTFEHLYNPRRFIKSLQNSKVKEVFISVPNLHAQLNSGSFIIMLNFEHTFFYTDDNIINIFRDFNFSLKSKFSFELHSSFFHFVYNEDIENTQTITPVEKILPELKKYFTQRKETIQSLSIINPFFIAPSGPHGAQIYYFLKGNNNVCLGFLDNDPTKQYKYLYGTTLITFPYSILYDYIGKSIQIILCKSAYSNEIKLQMKSISDTFHILEI